MTREIGFPGATPAQAAQWAQELERMVRESPVSAEARLKGDPAAQDFGGTLILVLGAPAVVVVAQGIAAFIRLRGRAVSIKGEGKDKEIMITGAESGDLASIVEAALKDPQ
ncbi:MAG: hypothetical protein AB7P34_04805 [Vicinamibacterales bacterium]